MEEEYDDLPELCESSAANSDADDQLQGISADESWTEDDHAATSNHAMVEFTADDGMEDAVDTATLQARAAEDETHGDGTHSPGDSEGGVRGGDGGGEPVGPSGASPRVGRPLGRAVASSFF